ncbi:MAG: 2-phosphosulfolactate phosphatase [Bryobacteraceae bacterium]
MPKTFVIDCFPESARKYRAGHAVIAIDVIRATTMAITAVALGRRCYPVHSLDEARKLAASLPGCLLAGELAGVRPDGFEMTNSPAELSERTDIERSLVLLSSSGTRLIFEAAGAEATYLACFRNYEAVAQHLIGRHPSVAIIGAGSRGEFREEDQMCCAWTGGILMGAGYEPADEASAEIVERWHNVPPRACASGNSAKYLERTGYGKDLDYILDRINDLSTAFRMESGEVVELAVRPVARAHEAHA